MANIAKDGAPKKTQTTFETATPPHVVKIGDVPVPIPGMSRTTASRALYGDKLGVVNSGGENPATLKAGHLAVTPKVHPGMVSKRQREASTDSGGAVLAEGKLAAGK